MRGAGGTAGDGEVGLSKEGKEVERECTPRAERGEDGERDDTGETCREETPLRAFAPFSLLLTTCISASTGKLGGR